MKDVIDTVIPLLTLAVMIASAVISANKKKKEAAAKATRSVKPKAPKVPVLTEASERHTVPKSLGEILEELARGDAYSGTEEEFASPEDDYFGEEMARMAEEEGSAAARLAAMTYKPMRPDSVERNTKTIVEEIPTATNSASGGDIGEPEDDSIEAILADFDLRRAVIESEILRPKYEQY